MFHRVAVPSCTTVQTILQTVLRRPLCTTVLTMRTSRRDSDDILEHARHTR